MKSVKSIVSLGFDTNNFGNSYHYYMVIKEHPGYIRSIRNLSKDIIKECIKTIGLYSVRMKGISYE